jgi:parallel beta helix pectate lyase-like protein
MRLRALLALCIAAAMLVPSAALGHSERHTESPVRPGKAPDPNRTPTEIIDVCKTGECAYEHIQSAVNAAHDGALIRIWPGVYKEEPSRATPDLPADNADGTYSYEFHVQHPNAQNLIAVLGKKSITLRGMGAISRDVVVDAGFHKHVGIRADRADGFIIQNVSFWHSNEHGVYVLDQDGFLIDNVMSGYSGEYAFLTFATDHGIYRNCEAVGAGDAGIYPGGSADTPGRWSTEVDHCVSYHNINGYSGTQGDHVWVHDSEFYDNGLGLVSDSETDHPNYPENGVVWERNKIYDNNFDYYAETSDVAPVEFDEAGAGLNGANLPVGVGVFFPSGNENLLQNNQIWGNSRYGVWLATGQGLVVGPTSEPAAQPFMSSGNRFIGNRMFAPTDVTNGKPNGTDFVWDGLGLNNCWQDNTATATGGTVSSNLVMLPPCQTPLASSPVPLWIPDPVNLFEQASIAKYDGRPICDYVGYQPCAFGPGPAKGKAKNKPESDGGVPDSERTYLPNPTPCGPSTCPHSSSTRATFVLGVKTARTFSMTASALPATGVGTPIALALALIVGAAVTAVMIRKKSV